jgi:hypothetical protein
MIENMKDGDETTNDDLLVRDINGNIEDPFLPPSIKNNLLTANSADGTENSSVSRGFADRQEVANRVYLGMNSTAPDTNTTNTSSSSSSSSSMNKPLFQRVSHGMTPPRPSGSMYIPWSKNPALRVCTDPRYTQLVPEEEWTSEEEEEEEEDVEEKRMKRSDDNNKLVNPYDTAEAIHSPQHLYHAPRSRTHASTNTITNASTSASETGMETDGDGASTGAGAGAGAGAGMGMGMTGVSLRSVMARLEEEEEEAEHGVAATSASASGRTSTGDDGDDGEEMAADGGGLSSDLDTATRDSDGQLRDANGFIITPYNTAPHTAGERRRAALVTMMHTFRSLLTSPMYRPHRYTALITDLNLFSPSARNSSFRIIVKLAESGIDFDKGSDTQSTVAKLRDDAHGAVLSSRHSTNNFQNKSKKTFGSSEEVSTLRMPSVSSAQATAAALTRATGNLGRDSLKVACILSERLFESYLGSQEDVREKLRINPSLLRADLEKVQRALVGRVLEVVIKPCYQGTERDVALGARYGWEYDDIQALSRGSGVGGGVNCNERVFVLVGADTESYNELIDPFYYDSSLRHRGGGGGGGGRRPPASAVVRAAPARAGAGASVGAGGTDKGTQGGGNGAGAGMSIESTGSGGGGGGQSASNSNKIPSMAVPSTNVPAPASAASAPTVSAARTAIGAAKTIPSGPQGAPVDSSWSAVREPLRAAQGPATSATRPVADDTLSSQDASAQKQSHVLNKDGVNVMGSKSSGKKQKKEDIGYSFADFLGDSTFSTSEKKAAKKEKKEKKAKK